MRVSHCFGVCALLAALTSASVTQAAPSDLTNSAGATALATFKKLSSLVQWEAAHSVTPNTIDPCWLVDLAFWNAANPANFQFKVTVHYQSGNHFFNRTVIVPMSEAIVVDPNDHTHDHEAFDETQWVRLRTRIEFTNHRPNADSVITGKVVLQRVDHDDDDDDGDDDHHHHHHGGGGNDCDSDGTPVDPDLAVKPDES